MKDKNKKRLMKAGILAMLLGMSGGQAFGATYYPYYGTVPDNTAGSTAIAIGIKSVVQERALEDDDPTPLYEAEPQTGRNSLAFGINSYVSGSWSTALGAYSSAVGYSNISLGERAATIGHNNIALGFWARVGDFDEETNEHVLPIGDTKYTNTMVIGSYVTLGGKGSNSVVIGNNLNDRDGVKNVSYITSVGVDTKLADSSTGVSLFGYKNEAKSGANYAVALGNSNTVYGENSVAVGYLNEAKSAYAQAIGSYNESSNFSIAIGSGTSDKKQSATGGYSVAVGYQNVATTDRATAIGYQNTAGTRSVKYFV